jgi:hypothetical protein
VGFPKKCITRKIRKKLKRKEIKNKNKEQSNKYQAGTKGNIDLK